MPSTKRCFHGLAARAWLLLVVLAPVSACSAPDAERDSSSAPPPPIVGARPEPVIAAAPAGYRVESMDAVSFGRIAGAVEFQSPAPADTLVFPTSDLAACGAALSDNSLSVTDGGVGGAVVWLAEIPRGKEFPQLRRHELTHDRCVLQPRTQAVAVGGTLNVRNLDHAVHHTRFTLEGSGDVLARVAQSERGQVVPSERVLAQEGLIRVSCDAHPWTRAWIFVFPHPYFAVTGRGGRFELDSVPVGRYELVVWHERASERRMFVEVSAGDSTAIRVLLDARR